MTALHWAAINNEVKVASTLVQHGALVDAKGGDLMGTPLHWAVRQGHLSMVIFLFRAGADPDVRDNQGYNALHLSAHGGYPMVLIYLICGCGMDLEAPDSNGRTSSMWVAYQGKSVESMRILIRLNADLNRRDATGFTALHWAVVTGHLEMARMLVENGATVDQQDNDGKTPLMWAQERGYSKRFERILAEGPTHLEQGAPTVDKRTTDRAMTVIPFVLIGIIPISAQLFPWWLSSIVGLVALFVTIVFITPRYLGGRDSDETPLLSAIFQASAFWLGLDWLLFVLGGTIWKHPIANFGFLATFSAMVYYHTLTTYNDPGFLKPSTNSEEQKRLVQELADLGKLDTRHFCVSCQIRKPPRSKHCKICKKCVQRFDHHCPWTNNCMYVSWVPLTNGQWDS